jgi:enamine deaminase RidA (YjgF/YER057c/UK114 family)
MRKNISSKSPFEPVIGFSRAVRIGNAVYLAGTAPAGAKERDAAGQTRHIFQIAATALAEAGASLQDVVRTRIYLVHPEDWYFSDIRPAATMVVVSQLLDPAWRVEIEMDAVISGTETGAAPDPKITP